VYPGKLGFLPTETYKSHLWQQKIPAVFQKNSTPQIVMPLWLCPQILQLQDRSVLQWMISPSHKLHRKLTTIRFLQVHEEILCAVTIAISYMCFPITQDTTLMSIYLKIAYPYVTWAPVAITYLFFFSAVYLPLVILETLVVEWWLCYKDLLLNIIMWSVVKASGAW